MEKREKTCVEIFTLCRDAMDFRSMYFDVFWRYQCSKRSQNQEMLFPSAKEKPIYIYIACSGHREASINLSFLKSETLVES